MTLEAVQPWFQDPAWVAAVASALGTVAMSVAAIITAWNAVIARRLLDETQKAREAQLTPTLVVRFAVRRDNDKYTIGYLMVENLGPGVAFGVKLTMRDEDDYVIAEERRLSSLTPFVIPADMKPGQQTQSVAICRKADAQPGQGYPRRDFPITASCRDSLGRQHSWSYTMPQDPIEGYLDTGYSRITSTGEPHLLNVSNEIRALREFLERRSL